MRFLVSLVIDGDFVCTSSLSLVGEGLFEGIWLGVALGRGGDDAANFAVGSREGYDDGCSNSNEK